MTDTKELIARLRAKRQVLPAFGGGTITAAGEAETYIIDDGKRLLNPDGPEAADLLERRSEALRLIADIPDPGAGKERSATFYRVHAAMLKQVAAKALGRETVSPAAFAWADEWLKSEEGRQATQCQEKA